MLGERLTAAGWAHGTCSRLSG